MSFVKRYPVYGVYGSIVTFDLFFLPEIFVTIEEIVQLELGSWATIATEHPGKYFQMHLPFTNLKSDLEVIFVDTQKSQN